MDIKLLRLMFYTLDPDPNRIRTFPGDAIVMRPIIPRSKLGVIILLGTVCPLFGGPSPGQPPGKLEPDTQTVSSDGFIHAQTFQLRYRIEGKGRPAIVIGSALYYPRVFSQNLRNHLKLVFLDHRGFAPAPDVFDKSAFALDSIVDDIERARRQLGLGQIVVIGHSGHAYMALEYAKKYPSNVSHVILIGAAPDMSAASNDATERYWQESASPERKAALRENVRKLPDSEIARLPAGQRLVKSYIQIGPRAWYDFRFDATPLWAGVTINADAFDYLWNIVFRDIDITRGLGSFNRPVLVALGRHDFIVAPPSSWDRIKPNFANLTVRIFEQSGHTPPYEEPERFDSEILGFLAKH